MDVTLPDLYPLGSAQSDTAGSHALSGACAHGDPEPEAPQGEVTPCADLDSYEDRRRLRADLIRRRDQLTAKARLLDAILIALYELEKAEQQMAKESKS